MRYPHICGTVDAVQRQPTLIPLSTGIGCPDFLRSFEDMPPPPTTTNLEYPYATPTVFSQRYPKWSALPAGKRGRS